MSKRLKQIRQKIDQLDKEIIKLLNSRADLAKQVKIEKDNLGDLNIFKPERESQILRNLPNQNKGPLSENHLYIIFREIMSACLSLETKLSVTCLGPEMSYSHLALIRYFGSAVKTIYSSSIKDIFSDVDNVRTDYGIVPIENSNQGSIKETLDYLISSDVSICGEVNLGVKHCLLSHSKKLSGIKTIYAHEQTFRQCSNWIEKNFPHVKLKPVGSNSLAVKKVNKLPNCAAIASEYCSLFYSVPLLKRNIQDFSGNSTRFIVIGKKSVASSGKDKTTILISLHNTSGSLVKLLKPLSDNRISMSKIESMPTKVNNWEYMFVIDIDGHSSDKKLGKALTEIEKNCIFFKNLGSYPANS